MKAGWKKRKSLREGEWKTGLVLILLSTYRYLQRHWVCRMEQLVQGWSIGKQKAIGVIFFVGAFLYCLGLVYRGVKGDGVHVTLQKIKTGEHIGSPTYDSTKK